MIKHIKAAALILFCAAAANAHEMTPTYPKLVSAYVSDVVTTKMHIWNRRRDVSYYEIFVFDKDFNEIKFASQDKVIKLDYLEHRDFEIYIRERDEIKVEYICTTSKHLKQSGKGTNVKSTICSRIER